MSKYAQRSKIKKLLENTIESHLVESNAFDS